MSSREEKLSAARRKLRKFQEKNKDVDESRHSGGNTASPDSPLSIVSDLDRKHSLKSESPVDSERLTYERRQTVQMGDTLLPTVSNLQPYLQSHENSVLVNFEKNENVSNPESIQLEHLQHHVYRQNHAISLLVSERNEAQTLLSKVQSELQQKTDAMEDIKIRYIQATRRIYELENASPRPLTSVMVSQVEEELKGAQELAAQKISHLQERLSELNLRLTAKNTECENLYERVSALDNALSVAQVKIQQLTTEESLALSVQEDKLKEDNLNLKKQVELLERRLQAVAIEGEQAARKFQIYTDQCNNQQTTLRAQVKKLTDDCRSLTDVNSSLSANFQKVKEEMNSTRNQDTPLEARLADINKENVKLFQELQEKDSIIERLKSDLSNAEHAKNFAESELQQAIEKLRNERMNREKGHPDGSVLLAAIESEKVAASRAVSQNHQLKQQLTELEQAFIRLSNEKMTLVEKGSQLEHENSMLKVRLDALDYKISEDRDYDAEEFEIEGDVDNLRQMVKVLRNDKSELVTRLHQLQTLLSKNPHSNHNSHAHQHSPVEISTQRESHSNNNNIAKQSEMQISELHKAVKQLQEDKAQLLSRLGSSTEDPEVQGMLEVKLRRTMNDIAALDEEKQRLEHLVLQLQGETETIGEYITLYHKQRLLLKQRSLEKDEQVSQLSKDREELQNKLSVLNELVSKLVGEKPESPESPIGVEQTADKILALITEIGNSQVITSHAMAFEQCSCCSGRLITV